MIKTCFRTISILIGILSICCVGCRIQSDTAGSASAPTKITLYFASPYSYMVAPHIAATGPTGSGSPTISSVTQTIIEDSWIKPALQAIEDFARIELAPIALKSWEVSDGPDTSHNILLDEDALRARLPGVLPDNPYDSNPPKCDLVYFDYRIGAFSRYLEANYFQPVEQLLKSHAPNLWSSYPPSYWESQRIYGEIWGIPATGVVPNSLMPPYWIVRADILSQNSISPPKTFSELVNIAVSLKSEHLCDVPLVFASNRFNIFDYMLDINGFRSFTANLIFYDSQTGIVSSIFDGPMEILSEAIEIVTDLKEVGASIKTDTTGSSGASSTSDFGYLAATRSWLALYVDYTEPVGGIYRKLAVLSDYNHDVEYTVMYFAPTDRRYFKPVYSSFRNTYFIPTHTDKAVDIVRMFEVMNTREGYDALHTAEHIEGKTVGDVLLYTPTQGSSNDSEGPGRYPVISAISSDPLHIPIYEKLFPGALQSYYERYTSHDLADYYWDDPVFRKADLSDTYMRFYELTRTIRERMNRYFTGESIDVSWFQSLEEIKPQIESFKVEFQRLLDKARVSE